MKRLHHKNIILLIFISVFAIACEQEQTEENGETTPNGRQVAVETVVMEPHQFNDFIRLTGTVEAIEDAMISAEVSGRIMDIVERGTRVSEGETIARLDDRQIRAQYNSAEAAYEQAVDNFERMESLHADSIVSTQDYRNARAQLDQARAQLDQAEKQLQDSNIEAPFDGRIEERMVQAGELVSPGQPVVRLVNTSQVRILAGIPERYSGEITEGTEVEVRLNGDQVRTSRITYSGDVIDPDTRTYTVEIELSNPDRLIKPDMVVDLRIQRRTLEDALIIPRTAVIRSEDGISVFKAVEGNGNKVASLSFIETGQASGPLIEVTSGVQPGDEIVISGISNLNEGDQLNILNTETSIERAERLQSSDGPFVSY